MRPSLSLSSTRLIGLIPAAGRATRLAPLPCSKELLPVGYEASGPDQLPRPKVVSQYFLEKLRAAGATDTYFIIRSGKWDIAEYFGNGARLGMHIGYLMVTDPYGPPFTLDQAYTFTRDSLVLTGFPDILFQPRDAFARAVERLERVAADAVIGAFPSHPGNTYDVCELDADGRVRRITAKEQNPAWQQDQKVWLFVVWGPAFSEFLHAEVASLRALALSGAAGADPEWPLGVIVDAAVHAGLHVDSVYFEDGVYLDIGTPVRLTKALGFPGVWSGVGKPVAADG